MPIDMKSVIADTLLTMTQRKGIDKITVKALIEECHISRQTFYYHFQDIMEVIEWAMEQAVQNTLKYSLNTDSPEEAFVYLLDSSVKNHELILKLMNSQKREQIEKLFVHATKTYLQALIENKVHDLSLNYSDVEVALNFYAFGISGLLLMYCQHDDIDTKKLAKQISQFLPLNNKNK